MEFLGFVGTSELIVCAIVALIIFGPNRLPELARHFAKLTKMFREASRELHRQIDFNEIEREFNRQPKAKAVTATTKKTTENTYPYGKEDESAHYNKLGADGGYDGYSSAQSSSDTTKNEQSISLSSENKNTASVNDTINAKRFMVDESIKTQDAARLQREVLD